MPQPATVQEALPIADKYYKLAYMLLGSSVKGAFDRTVDWGPVFDGKKKDYARAAVLCRDVSTIVSLPKAPDITLALACAAFDIASDDRTAALNLGCAIAMFFDNHTHPAVLAQGGGIYKDAETVLLYSLELSKVKDAHTYGSLEPLAALGNLYLDAGRNEDAKDMFEAALRIDRHHKKALEGMLIYYTLAKKPQLAAGIKASAQERPSELGKAANDIGDAPSRAAAGKDESGYSAEDHEAHMDELAEIEVVSYADLIERLDKAYADKIRKSVDTIKKKMIIKIPDATILTQYTTLNESNHIQVESALKAIEEEIRRFSEYAERAAKGQGNETLDSMDRMGFKMKIGSMNFTDYARDLIKNPKKHENDNLPDPVLDMGSVMSWVNDAIGGISVMMKQEMTKDAIRPLAQTDPMFAVLGMNPFDYANSLDVLVQQYNVWPLMKKQTNLSLFLAKLNMNATNAIKDIMMTHARARESISKAEEEAWDRLHKWYEGQRNSSHPVEGLELRYKLKCHDIHKDFYPKHNQCGTPYWNQATQVASVAYKKIEKYVPKMYRDVMTHIAAISDPKLREGQERKLNSTMANGIVSGLSNLLTAYSTMQYRDARMCSCDLEELEAMRLQLKELEKKLGNEYLERQRKAKDSFKNNEIDFNSKWYKDYIKKWEYSIDVGVYKYATSEFYTLKKVNIWTPGGSFESSSFINHLSGAGSRSADLTLGPSAGAFSLEAKFGYTVDFVRDKEGKDHIRDIDLRASAEGKIGVGPVAVKAGASASIAKGTKIYGEVGLTGNKYLDDLKEKALGERLAPWTGMPGIPQVPDLSLKLWSGEYTLE